MRHDRFSVDLVACFAHPIDSIYDTCFKAVAALHGVNRHTASIGVHSRGLPYIPPADDWHRFHRKGKICTLYDNSRRDLPPESQVGGCCIEDVRDRWAIAYSRRDKIDDLPADPFLYLSYEDGEPVPADVAAPREPMADGLAVCKEFFRITDSAGRCYFGFADANMPDHGGGSLYGEFPTRPMTWRQEVEHVDWWTAGDKRRQRVREVYWGMYLSAPMLERLPPDLLDRFLDVETEDEKPQTITRYESGAAFLAMSADPLDAPSPFPFGPDSPAVCNAVWLRQRLREGGLL